MKVLVTGGCGFIGSWACEYYARAGHDVVSFDNMTKFELTRTGYNVEQTRDYNWNFLKELGVTMVEADIRNRDMLFDQVSSCDFIIHTAAQPAVTISIDNPELDCTTNVLGTLNVLEAARKFDIPIVSCATIHVYGNDINDELSEGATRYTRDPAAIDEDYPLLGGNITPLHASKMAGDIYVRTYIQSYGTRAASFRLTGLYGPRQFGGEDHGWVANFCIRAILGIPISIFGTGKQVRDILFAADLVDAFDAFYRNPQPGVYNIGGGEQQMISLLESIKMIGEIMGKPIDVSFEDSRYGDLQYFVCNTARAQSALKWEPSTKPREGIERLITWITDNKELFQT